MNNTEVERIARVETEVKNIRDDIIDLRDNHIASIYKKIDAVNGKLIAILTAVLSALILGIVNMVIKG